MREVKRVLHIETSTQARELLAVVQALVAHEGWALFVQLVEAAYSDEAFAGQATTILSGSGPVERQLAELVGQRKAARYVLSLPVQIISQCRAMVDEGNRGDVADST